MNNTGWICPICGRGVAPTEKYCNCKEVQPSPCIPYQPTGPSWPDLSQPTIRWQDQFTTPKIIYLTS